jgi:hypothetical protein
MNQRDSSGLPLRAMVMVLLFLGVVFLLVGFQAMGGGDSDGEQSSLGTTTITTTSSATPSPSPAPAKADVRVYNISSIEGEAPGERAAADEVGKLLDAPVQPRVPELAEQPPGVVVAVTG